MQDVQRAGVIVQLASWQRHLGADVRQAWESLLTRLPIAPASYYPEWWEIVRGITPAQPWQVLIIRHAGQPIMVMPLQRRSYWVWEVPSLFADDIPPVLIDPQQEEIAWQGLAQWLARTRHVPLLALGHCLDTRRMAMAEAACQAAGCYAQRTAEQPVFTAPLAEDWEAYLNGLSANTRKNVRSGERGLVKHYPTATIHYPQQPEEITRAVEDFIAIYIRRWSAQDGILLFDDARYAAAFTAIIRHFTQRNLAAVGTLRVDGGTIAAGTYLHTPGQAMAYWHYTARDPQALPARFSTGIILTADSIRWFIARGARRLHMGNGESTYKTDYGASAQPRWTFTLAHSAKDAALAATLDRTVHVLRRAPVHAAYHLRRLVAGRGRSGEPVA